MQNTVDEPRALRTDSSVVAIQTSLSEPASAQQSLHSGMQEGAPVHLCFPCWAPALCPEQQRVKPTTFPACFLCSLTCSVLLRPDPSIEKSRLVQKHKQASPLKPV